MFGGFIRIHSKRRFYSIAAQVPLALATSNRVRVDAPFVMAANRALALRTRDFTEQDGIEPSGQGDVTENFDDKN
jgi:hypothetical protein